MKKYIILEFFKDVNNAWRFHFKSSNGRILASSEAYSSINKAIQGADAILLTVDIKVNAPPGLDALKKVCVDKRQSSCGSRCKNIKKIK